MVARSTKISKLPRWAMSGHRIWMVPGTIQKNITGLSILKPPDPVWVDQWKKEQLSPRAYHYFLRINNRRRRQTENDIKAAGYVGHVLPHLTMIDDYEEVRKIDEWCDHNFGQHTWLRFRWCNTWWFSCSNNATRFFLTWG